VASDEVYGGGELRRGIRQREMAVRAWHRIRTGLGTKGIYQS